MRIFIEREKNTKDKFEVPSVERCWDRARKDAGNSNWCGVWTSLQGKYHHYIRHALKIH